MANPILSASTIDKIVANLMIGIPAVESAKDGYKAHNREHSNPDMQALGKYQFVPKYWWKSIQKFAKNNGYEVNSYQDFLDTPSLQDAYFRHYVKTEVLPQAEKLASGKNPGNLSVEDIAVNIHFQGYNKSKELVSAGTERGGTKAGKDGSKVTNLATDEYRSKYHAALKESGMEPLKTVDMMSDEEKLQAGKSYFDAVDGIRYGAKDLNDVEKNKRIQEIQAEFKAEGLIPAVNFYIDKQNEKNEEKHGQEFQNKKENLIKILDVVSRGRLKDGKWTSVGKDVEILKEAFKDLGVPRNVEVDILLPDLYKEVTGKSLTFDQIIKIEEVHKPTSYSSNPLTPSMNNPSQTKKMDY